MIEKLLAWLAPHYCISCGFEGTPFCGFCRISEVEPVGPRCYRCFKMTNDYKTCASCRSSSSLTNVWVSSIYIGHVKHLLGVYKFKRLRSASQALALLIDDRLPHMDDVVLVPIETATSRVRHRGYDQSVLVAKELAKKRDWEVQRVISKVSQSRQTGSIRDKRIQQAKAGYRIHGVSALRGRSVLLLDDILTTGSTLESVARMLRDEGVGHVSAVVVAQKIS